MHFVYSLAKQHIVDNDTKTTQATPLQLGVATTTDSMMSTQQPNVVEDEKPPAMATVPTTSAEGDNESNIVVSKPFIFHIINH